MFVVTYWVIQALISWVITGSSSKHKEFVLKGKYVTYIYIHIGRAQGLNKPSVTENGHFSLQSINYMCI